MATIDTDAEVLFRSTDCSLEDFRVAVERRTDVAAYPHSSGAERGVLVYDAADLRRSLGSSPTASETIGAELRRALSVGPGVLRIAGAFDPGVVDRVSDAFRTMIDDQRRAGIAAGDHFAKPGDNDRVWNALEKLAIADPDAFVDYYGNDLLALGAVAWLGPGYQVTSQVNVVNPGGAAQQPHRDYHLGFLTDEVAEQYPAHVHRFSPQLTLQGVVAHIDMPAATGPTLVLPYSHQYDRGYLAWRRPEFIEYFADHKVQPELDKGDLVYLNPAVFHAGGQNRTPDVRRMANLLQISSALGRAMENVDRYRMTRAIYPTLRRRWRTGDRAASLNALAACAEGYAFPTNLDFDQPIGRLTPQSAAEVAIECLDGDDDLDALASALFTHAERRLSR